jgi:allantoinase
MTTGTSGEFAIVGKRVLTPEGLQEAAVIVRDGKIAEVVTRSQVPQSMPVEDAGDHVVMPGLVDSHVHVNEPGRTEWEGFESATAAAAAGGITTIADMPLNSNPVTTTAEALEHKRQAAKGKLKVDTAYLGGVIPGNAGQLEPLIDAGVSGFKCFLIHSGIDDFPNVTESDLDLAMPILARRGVPLLVHAELECGAHPDPHFHWSDPRSYRQFVQSRPRQWENDAVDLMIKLARRHNCRVHIVHLSSSEALPALRAAQKEGVPISAETCPHYLHFQMETIPDGDPRYKCAPPIREDENCKLLWQALEDGTIDFVVSDHSPCSPDLKFLQEGDLQKAWGGIAGLQFTLCSVWTYAKARGVSLAQISAWMSGNTARFLGVDSFKGKLAPGMDADIVIFDPDATTRIERGGIHHKHKETPYEGRELAGKVLATYLRGRKIYERGQHTDKSATGMELLHKKVGSKA